MMIVAVMAIVSCATSEERAARQADELGKQLMQVVYDMQ